MAPLGAFQSLMESLAWLIYASLAVAIIGLAAGLVLPTLRRRGWR